MTGASLLALALLAAAMVSTSAANAAAASAGFVTLPMRSTATETRAGGAKAARQAPALPLAARPAATSSRIAGYRPPASGRLCSSATTTAAAAAEQSTGEGQEEKRKRRATKGALLRIFGEGVDDQTVSDAAVDPILACPSTLGELTDGFRSYGGVGPGSLAILYKTSERMPGVKYRIEPDFVDFGEPPKPSWRLTRGESVKEGTFQSPIVPWLYERGWRQSFNANGFPGIDEEFRQVSEYFSSTGADGGAVMDLSCGSGLMMRRLVASNRYSRVIGGDLSPTMLAETARRFREEGLGAPELVRCDVSRLPVKTESLHGVHAGAALHCWSKLEESLSEVHRVLKPGKGFFATTFLTTASLSRSQRGDADGFKFFEVDELDGLMRDAGFADVKVVKEGRACAIIRATKGA